MWTNWSNPLFKKVLETAERSQNYLFRPRLSSLLLFRKTAGSGSGRQIRLMIRNCRYSRADPELIRKVFHGDKKRIRRFETYLKKGAEGYLLYTDHSWVGYLWTIRIELKKRNGRTLPRTYNFAGLPKDFEVEDRKSVV